MQLILTNNLTYYVGGNQRETDRAKAAKKQAALNKSKAKESNTSLAKRKEAYVSLFISFNGDLTYSFQRRRDSESEAEGMIFSSYFYPHIVWLTLPVRRNEMKRRQQKLQQNLINNVSFWSGLLRF